MTNQSLVVLPGHAGRLMSLLARGKAAICRVLDAGVMTRYQQHDLIPPMHPTSLNKLNTEHIF